MKLHIVIIVTIAIISDKASCGVVEGVYDKVSNTTQAVKDDVYKWWSYSVDSVMGEGVSAKNDAVDEKIVEEKDQSGIISRLYNKVKGGVSSGYKKIHDFVLGEDSDPNKGIIKTLYQRAMQRLSDITSYVFGDCCQDEKPQSQANEDDTKQKVLKLLFSNNTDIINTESEKLALDSLRRKLTQTGEEALKLADNERDLIKKVYNSVRRKSDELLANVNKTVDNVKNNLNENIEKTQEFIQEASKMVNEGANNTRIGQEVKKSADDVAKKMQSE